VQWVPLGVVVAGFGAIELRLLLARARPASVRDSVKKEAVVHRTPISAQWGRGWWGRGNVKGMQLVVRDHSFELSYPFPGGSFLTSEWYCRARDGRMKMGVGRFLPPRIKRACIVLSIPSLDNPDDRQEILLTSRPPRNDLRGAWDALLASGVVASGDPPPNGT